MNMYGHYTVERFAQNINAKSLDLHYDCVHTLLLLGPLVQQESIPHSVVANWILTGLMEIT